MNGDHGLTLPILPQCQIYIYIYSLVGLYGGGGTVRKALN